MQKGDGQRSYKDLRTREEGGAGRGREGETDRQTDGRRISVPEWAQWDGFLIPSDRGFEKDERGMLAQVPDSQSWMGWMCCVKCDVQMAGDGR